MELATRIMLEDIGVLIAGIIIGMAIVTFRMAINLQRVYISPETKGTKISLIRIKDEKTGEEAIYANPDTFRQSLEFFITLFIWNMTGRKQNILLQNRAKQDFLFWLYVLLVVVSTVYVVYAIQHFIGGTPV